MRCYTAHKRLPLLILYVGIMDKISWEMIRTAQKIMGGGTRGRPLDHWVRSDGLEGSVCQGSLGIYDL